MASEISKNTDQSRYNPYSDCPICYEPKRLVAACANQKDKHQACETCLEAIRASNQCPQCRGPIEARVQVMPAVEGQPAAIDAVANPIVTEMERAFAWRDVNAMWRLPVGSGFRLPIEERWECIDFLSEHYLEDLFVRLFDIKEGDGNEDDAGFCSIFQFAARNGRRSWLEMIFRRTPLNSGWREFGVWEGARFGHLPVVEFLLQGGRYLSSESRRDAIRRAQNNGHDDIVEFLQSGCCGFYPHFNFSAWIRGAWNRH